jgi:hypothetical protein
MSSLTSMFPAYGSRTGKFIPDEEVDNELESDQDSPPDYAPSVSSSGDDSDTDDEIDDSDNDYHPHVTISHRSQVAKKTPEQGYSDTPSPSHALEDDDDPDDVQLKPQTIDVSNDSAGSYAAPVSSRPQRARKPVDRYTPVHLAAAQGSNYDSPTFPKALQRDVTEHWRKAIVDEINKLKARGTWTLVSRPKNTRVLPSKVVLKIKRAQMVPLIAIRHDLLRWDACRRNLTMMRHLAQSLTLPQFALLSLWPCMIKR